MNLKRWKIRIYRHAKVKKPFDECEVFAYTRAEALALAREGGSYAKAPSITIRAAHKITAERITDKRRAFYAKN